MMNEEESREWRPEIVGWSDDILPAYEHFVAELPSESACVELGVAHGRSVIFLAEKIAAAGKRATIEAIDHFSRDDWEALAGHLDASPDEVALMIKRVKSKTTAAALERNDRSRDFIFVDADHSYEGCLADMRAWWPKLKPGGIFAGHDYSTVDFPGVVRAVDEFAAERGLKLERPTRSVWRLR